APVDLSALVAGLLGVSTALMMIAQVLQPALVALGQHRSATTAWLLGTAVFGGLLFAPTSPLFAAVTAQLAGPAIVLMVMAFTLRTALHRTALNSHPPPTGAPPSMSNATTGAAGSAASGVRPSA
ncbi:MAG: hypothetical protein ACRDRM_06050, partial [Pseudonocardiaceae bacterium]